MLEIDVETCFGDCRILYCPFMGHFSSAQLLKGRMCAHKLKPALHTKATPILSGYLYEAISSVPRGHLSRLLL